MKSLLVKTFGIMAIIAVLYCNYHAVRETKPLFSRLFGWIRNSRVSKWIGSATSRVTDSNIVQGTKSTVTNIGGRVVHQFKRSEKNASSQA